MSSQIWCEQTLATFLQISEMFVQKVLNTENVHQRERKDLNVEGPLRLFVGLFRANLAVLVIN